MKTLISPTRVLTLAFGDGEQLPAGSVTAADIAAAEERYLVPVVGRALHERLLAGLYPELTADYLAAPLALFTRAAIQPRLDLRTGRCGPTVAAPDGSEPADTPTRRRLVQSLRSEARTLLRRASRHLRTENRRYPEYVATDDIISRCTTDGGLVQTL